MSSHHLIPRRRRAAVPLVAVLGVAGLVLSACSSGKATGDDPTYPTGQTITVSLIAPSAAQDAANDYLKATFEAKFPGNKLVVEKEAWGTYQDDYAKELIDGKGTIPDVVEMGNTQTPGFTATGALLDLTDRYEDLGGDDLLPGFVEIGSYEGRFFAPPYYSIGHVVLGSSDIVSGTIPESLGEYVAAGTTLKEKKSSRSGIYLPGKDWYDVMPYVWENGGYIAKQADDGSWKAGFSSSGGIIGLVQAQNVMKKANNQKVGPADADEADAAKVFCKGKIGYLAGPASLAGAVSASKKADPPGCGTTYGDPSKLVAFALPGKEKGSVAATFAGGSNLGVAAKSKNPELAYQVLKIMTSPGYQDLMALNDFIPARITSAENLPQDSVTLASARAAQNAILTPASPQWATVESKQYLQDAFAEIAAGGSVPAIAKKLDKEIEDTLNAK
ncbi:extracellular solute-binding protein [Luteimicrobium sp. DT211]|uniref:extracellular solute-binding protein n=1 Tax=Luteimicrobium sp. DT211 TaxID=3393412 RepID=UPI003CE9ED6A